MLLLVVSTGACYHATVDTGLAPSDQVIDKPWAHSFLYGLVPPSTVETVAKCPNGAAKVETQLSFLNHVASFVTAGIYTPMQIRVTCAAVPQGKTAMTGNDPGAVVAEAAETSYQHQTPVYVEIGQE
ncbi:MAG TPA: hypothetical protein VNU46_06315 [Gemmatimonadaceae bacterium]|nr:hypothetical protein [Gemmatimonadaceae bacterium]